MSKYSTYERMMGKKIGIWWLILGLIAFYTLMTFGIRYTSKIEEGPKGTQNIKREIRGKNE